MWLLRAGVLLGFTAAAPASADTLRLNDGTELEGRVELSGSQVILHIDGGSIEFSESELASVDKTATPLDTFFQRRAALDPLDVSGRLKLARWASQQGLHSGASQNYKEVLALAPENQAAHTALGHTRVKGRWLTEAQFKRSKGLEQYLGRWMSPKEAEAKRQAAAKRAAIPRAVSTRPRTAGVTASASAPAMVAAPNSIFNAGWIANQSFAYAWGPGLYSATPRLNTPWWPGGGGYVGFAWGPQRANRVALRGPARRLLPARARPAAPSQPASARPAAPSRAQAAQRPWR